MSRSFICTKCKERKRPVDPGVTVCKSCKPRGRMKLTSCEIKNMKASGFILAA